MKKNGWAALKSIMLRGHWKTLPGLQVDVKKKCDVWLSETTVSARLRDLRKSKFGGYEIERRRMKNSKLYQYRLVH